jgi:hypothetical protein
MVAAMSAYGDSCTKEFLKSFSADDYARVYPCECGKVVRNVIVDSVPELSLVAVCGLRKSDAGRAIPIADRVIKLDSYSEDDLPAGLLAFVGKKEVQGELRFSGDYTFTFKRQNSKKKSGVAKVLRGIEFEDTSLLSKIAIPSKLKSENCVLVDVTLRINKLISTLAVGGNTIVDYEVISANGFRAC